jgi:7-methyl-GTP pyrophosphatase
MEMILASSSPYRQAVLKRLGVPFQAVNPEFTEFKPGSDLTPRQMVAANARGKALSLANRYPHQLIIGSDQVGILGDDVLLKPGSEEKAVAQLMRMSGREHQLLTGLYLLAPETDGSERKSENTLVVSPMRMRHFTADEAKEYVRRDQPLNCAGAYKAESLGIVLFEQLGGGDPTAIIGLPLIALTDLLQRLGHDPLNWSYTAPGEPSS